MPRLVCVGRLDVEKGQLLLVEAIAKLIADGIRCEIVLVGGGPLREQIQARIAQLHLSNSCFWPAPFLRANCAPKSKRRAPWW